jgi:hypothetical protein
MFTTPEQPRTMLPAVNTNYRLLTVVKMLFQLQVHGNLPGILTVK